MPKMLHYNYDCISSVSVTVSSTSRPTSVITTAPIDSNQQSDDSDENEKGEDRENAAPNKTGKIK